jgi:hypothetical protein
MEWRRQRQRPFFALSSRRHPIGRFVGSAAQLLFITID